jgi:phospho-N-acetylmuramoyl-pentapeptide-transferase
MLYELYLIFDINLFKYITVRAFGGFFISLSLVMILMPIFIKWAKQNKKQPINKYAPQNHQTKVDTPTMGGAVFLFTTIVGSLLTIDLSNKFAWIGIVIIMLFGFIGIRDDRQKIFANKNEAGMSAKVKILFQILFALIISILIYNMDFLTFLYIPFYKYPIFDMGIYAILLWTLVIVATSNAVNLTDGLDGLATFPSFLAFITLSIIIYITGSLALGQYLILPTFLGVAEVSILSSCFAGSLLGFLWYNSYPAEIFMGDSGSLPIGAFMGYLAIIAKSEVLLLLIGIIFVIETISVIMQVTSFKLRKKRIFLMTPIHHHFEIKGWVESKIIIRFWIISLISNLLAILTIKFR